MAMIRNARSFHNDKRLPIRVEPLEISKAPIKLASNKISMGVFVCPGKVGTQSIYLLHAHGVNKILEIKGWIRNGVWRGSVPTVKNLIEVSYDSKATIITPGIPLRQLFPEQFSCTSFVSTIHKSHKKIKWAICKMCKDPLINIVKNSNFYVSFPKKAKFAPYKCYQQSDEIPCCWKKKHIYLLFQYWKALFQWNQKYPVDAC